jgi:hypothetical protein
MVKVVAGAVEFSVTCEDVWVGEATLLATTGELGAVIGVEIELVAEKMSLPPFVALGTLLLRVVIGLDVEGLVAKIVFARFGSAFGLPLHRWYAVERTSRALFTP